MESLTSQVDGPGGLISGGRLIQGIFFPFTVEWAVNRRREGGGGAYKLGAYNRDFCFFVGWFCFLP